MKPQKWDTGRLAIYGALGGLAVGIIGAMIQGGIDGLLIYLVGSAVGGAALVVLVSGIRNLFIR